MKGLGFRVSKDKLSRSFRLGALGSLINGGSCSLLGIIWVLPGYTRGIQGLHKCYMR